MPKLRFKIGEKEVEAEGTEAEVISLYKMLLETQVAPLKANELQELEKNIAEALMPTFEDILNFLLSKTNYEHDIAEVERHFLKRTITSRDDPRIYRRLAFDLQKARKVIEQAKQGAFEQQATTSKNLKRYVFKPLTRTLNESLQKTS